ncbi:hypothetical protein PHMEG_00026190 [Phytophthora megakarya]|uniref:Uncharacterized protein n=1 Tax=Phytophthora megakarya TaxID=4795 RepID=A0A225VBX4_9STRA|nr:hypothetical protein PHMEG_00026190 [Phytophthora megakarya]
MDSSETSEWEPDHNSGEQGSETVAVATKSVPGEPPDPERRRFTGSGRRTEHNKQKWNAFEAKWKTLSEIPFPKLPVEQEVWHQAVQKHPNELMEWLQEVDSPEYILRTLKVGVILDWTRQFRIDCLLIEMAEIQEQVEQEIEAGADVDSSVIATLTSWVTFITEQREQMLDDSYIHSQDLWSVLNKHNPDKVKLLQLCRKRKADSLSRLLVAAYAYAPELRRLIGNAGSMATTTREVLDQFFEVLQKYPNVRRAYYGNVPDGDWAALESLLAIYNKNVQQAETETMED